MKYALINYKKANLDSTIKGLFHLSINDLENYLYPLAELSQCILDSSNGSIINVI